MDERPADEIARNALRHRWPRVRTWHLPPEPRQTGVDALLAMTREMDETFRAVNEDFARRLAAPPAPSLGIFAD